jgi:hypothetical protein
MEQTCKNSNCNKTFVRKDIRKIFCTQKCAKSYLNKNKSVKKIIKCVVCNIDFKQKSQSQVSCSSKCAKKNYLTIYKEKRSETQKIYNKKYKQKNKKLYSFYQNQRRILKLKATPKWADKEKIKQFYKKCPDGYSVDHIYPLKSNWICGLNVIENLQYLTISENSIKGNRKSKKYHICD